ncbi:MAG: DUF1722 domain-containing protein [Candidatus Electrothrix sp. GW3-4]|uniref:DUF1722 domain-containing protein n=1 Tax=Candidatus Electrothrix sp. GW3-4 TaxID=3126740 RepID=UPI0030D4D900
MRIWDINPGYLNRQSLLGEHRELHGIVSIIANGKKGYSKHPETLRWIGFGWALKMRHELLAAEMRLRGFNEKTPVKTGSNQGFWPEEYLDIPQEQFLILAEKYKEKEEGRIPLPHNGQQVWRQHKYSVMARDVNLYKKIGREVATASSNEDFSALTTLLTETLRTPPSAGGIRNSLQHMWGYISDHIVSSPRKSENWPLNKLLYNVQQGALDRQEPYLLASTALSELGIWIPAIFPPSR